MNKSYEKESEQIFNMASFFKKDKKFFYFLIDSSNKLQEGYNCSLISQSINNIIRDSLKDNDLFAIARYDEDI